MRPTLLTYKQSCDIVTNNSKVFLEKAIRVEGYNVSIFNYTHCVYNSFIHPLSDVDINALEMRGITYIFNNDGSIYNRYLMLPKFFNINQVESTLYSNIKNNVIESVSNKEDGSLVRFIELPNGSIIPKTIKGLDNYQTKASEILYENDDILRRLIKWSIDNHIALFFEYVSIDNKIVLRYGKPMLKLIYARNNDNGEYIDIRDIDSFGIEKAKFEYESRIGNDTLLDKLIDKSKEIENKEGWIIRFSNGETVKLKSKWYLEKHLWCTDIKGRPNEMIKLILDNKIDDFYSVLGDDDISLRNEVEDIQKIVINRYNDISNDIDELLLNYNGDLKVFANKYKHHELFHITVRVIKGSDRDKYIRLYIYDRIKFLKRAIKWLNRYK